MRFDPIALPGIAAFFTERVMFVIAEMIGHLSLHGPFHKSLGELLQKPFFSDEILGLLVILH